jgi:hypothetical protein
MIAAAGAAALAVYALVGRHRLLSWGSREPETYQALPGDELVRQPTLETTRAITIRAGAGQVWPWLAQIGYGRAGFYSYDWLESAAGLDIRSAGGIAPAWQQLQVGDSIPIAPGTPLRVAVCQPGRALVLHVCMNPLTARLVEPPDRTRSPWIDWSWAFVLRPLDEHHTRLLIRVRARYEPRRWLAPAVWCLLEPVHFLMERKMLLGIRQRAEALNARPPVL